MPRKGENIYKRKDGRWEGRYIGCYDENHKAKYVYIYGKTYTEVKQKLTIERGRQKQHVPAEKKQITYGEVLALWLHSTKTSIKESTYARYAHLINSHIKPQLGDYKLSMLSTEIIEDFIENQLVEGQLDRTGGLAPKTVIDLLAIVKSTIGYVKQSGISDANFHALRHTFATRCVEVGFEIKSLSEILGHASVNITLNRYVHSSFELKRSNMSKLIF